MPAAPRMRQLRRDKTVFSLAMNARRLRVEEDDRVARQPHLRESPDTELKLIQQVADQWVGLAGAYIVQKHRCSVPQAMQLLAELFLEIEQAVPLGEIRVVPLSQVMNLPPGLLSVNTAPEI